MPPVLALEERLQRLEDEMAIFKLIAAYGVSADACRIDNMEQLWHEQGVYDIEGVGIFDGHEALRRLFEGDLHQGITQFGSAHVATLPVVMVEGDRATATSHAMLFLVRAGDVRTTRLIACRWQLVRTPGHGLGWQVLRRTNRLLNGQAAARDILAGALDAPAPQADSTSLS